MDAVSDRVTRILMDGAREAYAPAQAVTPEMLLEICGCSHHSDDHHDADGRGRCSAEGCDCLRWHACQIECPDCGGTWDELAADCKHCGLTLDAIAERLSLGARGG